MASIYIETFGCQMNEADSEFIAERAASAGYGIASSAEEASVVVINTCTVRDNAERRAYGRLNHLKALKNADPSVKLVVCGCLAEQDRDRMTSLAPHVDGVFGTKDLARLAEALVSWRPDFVDDELMEERALAFPLGGRADGVSDEFSHLRAFVTVQRGCSYYCTFCIVPHVRGRFDHRPLSEILDEVRGRLRAGAREIMLVGQTVNAYREPATGADFADLLEAVAALDGLERLTFVTSHPKDFDAKLVHALAGIPQINPRLHLPVQSGSNAVLRRMNRKYTIESYLEKVAGFRRACPGWALTTDLIVGFPGETEADFEATLDVCRQVGFAQAYSFVYSPRRGTPAARWEQIPAALGAERLRRLAAVQDAAVRAFHERKVGSTVRALVQGPSRKDRTKVAAKTLDNVTVVAPGEARGAPWIDVEIEAAFTWGVTGTMKRRAGHFADAGASAASPVVDLLALR